MSWGTRLRAAPLALRELIRAARAAARGEPRRTEAALGFARQNATPGDPDSVLAALDRFAREHRFLMNVGDEKGKLLDAELERLGPGARVLELGCYCGYSAIRMARLLPSGAVTSLERSAANARVARDMVALAGLGERVEILEGEAHDLIPTLTGPFDLVFLDHSDSRYEPDLKRIEASRLLHAGSVVVADNVGPLFRAEAYLAYVRDSGRYDSRFVASHVEYVDSIEDGVEISTWRGHD